jgi:hypothetical protein
LGREEGRLDGRRKASHGVAHEFSAGDRRHAEHEANTLP